ncbi:DUF5050 domain-containing protein [Clostridium sp. BJN0001]|uniref:DUF5050 domain-containing protein n=1 Tax=Clostridium sp. BJN0001 TaxID=2930219 RepID=UPI001FD5E56F|nr:DUF5050 domain-containing protein [Clostridium sp. BJN0001]
MIKHKKLISLVIVFNTFLLSGCGSASSSTNSNNVDSNAAVSGNASTSIPVAAAQPVFSVSDNNYFSCPIIANNSSIIFANPDDNNNLSTLQSLSSGNILNTSNVQEFVKYSANSIALLEDTIYFADTSRKNALSSVTMSDKKYTKINNHSVDNLISVDSTLFYIDKTNGSNICSLDTSSNQVKAICTDKVGKFIINGSYVLYQNLSDKGKLYAVNVDGTGRMKLMDYVPESFIGYKDTVLFFNSSDNNNLYSLDPSTLETKRIAIMNGSDLKCDSKSIYFLNGSDSNNLYTLSVDLQNFKAQFKSVIKDSINEYYPTELGLFYERNLNVNNLYFQK